MQAVVLKTFGEPEQLILESLPTPEPGPGQVLLAIEAAGVGLMDVLLRRGTYRGAFQAPDQGGFVPGGEVAGKVIKLGQGVEAKWLNQRVFALLDTGGYADHVLADANRLMPIPDALSSTDAVGVGLNALVAKFAIERAQLKAGEQLLIRGAAGGIGVWVTQLAVAVGAMVSATTSSAERGQALQALGVQHVLARTADAEQGSNYDVIIDLVGGADLADFIARLNANGRMVICGAAGGFPPPEFGTALLMGFQKSLSLMTFSLNSIGPDARAEAMQTLFQQVITGPLKPIIQAALPLEQAAQAHLQLEAGSVFGKLLLVP